MSAFWDWIDNRLIVRRAMTIGTFVMTMYVISWAMDFAATSSRVGSDVAMIIGAIMAPLSALMGYLFGAYSGGRQA
jgi:hypothetical protein